MRPSLFPTVSLARRRWLAKCGALGATTALPSWLTIAKAQQASALNSLPRFALVMGNTAYRDAPLRNPVNDAQAVGGELQRLGFKVNIQTNAGRAQMSGAIQSFSKDLAQSKGVGLFYYAGHGAQLAWRNYMIPVDAAIERLEDMRDKAVELSTLLQGMIAARNAMNVIILDACRDNPFGNKVLTEQRGLSQFDAPPGSLLAYATSPGNTAADGEGSNGLYTENLLRELTVPEAKIEDVFKRVRLAVRRRSEGRQVPWESTSLEEDFYFQPPKQTKKLSADEQERQFEEELSIWEKIKASKESAALEDYLRRFPSGKFSEMAQFRLEKMFAQQAQLMRVAAAAATADAEAQRKRQDELARAEAELKKQQELSKAEIERKRQDELVRAEAERKRLEAVAKAEAERKRLEELARADAERRKQEDLAKAEAERQRQQEFARVEAEFKKQQALAKAEDDRQQKEKLARAEAELKKQQELLKAEAERKRQEEIARAETERKRQQALVQADAERKRLDELARADSEQRKKDELAGAEAERKRQDDLARAEAALRKQQQIALASRTAIEPATPVTPNPFSKGMARANADFKIGDSYSYRVIDYLTRVESRRFTHRITDISEFEIAINNGNRTIDLLGNDIKSPNENILSPRQYFPADYIVGKRWTTRFKVKTNSGVDIVEMDFKIAGRENIIVPAGSFDAFKIEGRGFRSGATSQWIYNAWMSPDVVRRPIAQEFINRAGATRYFNTDRLELVSYKQAG